MGDGILKETGTARTENEIIEAVRRSVHFQGGSKLGTHCVVVSKGIKHDGAPQASRAHVSLGLREAAARCRSGTGPAFDDPTAW